jgi:transposase InsO family protein
VELRKTLLLSLDDLLAVMRGFVNLDVPRSGLDRCLRRHGVSNFKVLQPQQERSSHAPFAAYEPGFVHIDVKYLTQMPDEDRRRYLFVAIDRATRWVFIQVKTFKSARAAHSFLAALIKTCPLRIRTILTDNGKEFTNRINTTGERTPTGQHVFDALCAALGIEHRLTRPRRPQTNGMVERFNGRIEEVLRSHHFVSGEDLERILPRYAWLYNHHLPQTVPQHPNARAVHERLVSAVPRAVPQAALQSSGTRQLASGYLPSVLLSGIACAQSRLGPLRAMGAGHGIPARYPESRPSSSLVRAHWRTAASAA